MKNILKILLALSLILSLLGCSAPEQTDEEKLTAILNTISADENITKMDAVKYAGQLAAFFKSSELSRDEVLAIVKPWLAEQAPEVKERLMAQLSELGDFLGEQGEKIQAGLADGSLQEKAADILDAIAASGGIK